MTAEKVIEPRIMAEPSAGRAIIVNGICGLENLGNTCYMNSIIQCLSNLPIFKSILLTSTHKPVSDDSVTSKLAALLNKMWFNTKIYITPIEFKKSIEKNFAAFNNYRQHDSQEFLTFILDKIHMELCSEVCIEFRPSAKVKELEDLYNTDKSAYKVAAKHDFDTATIFKSFIYWRNYINKNKHSFIIPLFTGLFHSIITCNECNYRRSSYSPFTTLSLSVSKDTKTLEDCLNEFFKEELLDGHNQYTCKDCNKKTDTKKQMTIWEPPKYIIIHFKRFETKYYPVLQINKINTLIKFPITGLVLDNYFNKLHPKYNYIYDLVGISNHMGGCSGGHYTSYCKNSISNKWYIFNDDSGIIQIPDEYVESHIVSEDAYILFYSKR